MRVDHSVRTPDTTLGAAESDLTAYLALLDLTHLGGDAELTDITCDVIGATRSRVRGRIVEVPPEDWGIGGVPASRGRRPEIVARSSRL